MVYCSGGWGGGMSQPYDKILQNDFLILGKGRPSYTWE